MKPMQSFRSHQPVVRQAYPFLIATIPLLFGVAPASASATRGDYSRAGARLTQHHASTALVFHFWQAPGTTLLCQINTQPSLLGKAANHSFGIGQVQRLSSRAQWGWAGFVDGEPGASLSRIGLSMAWAVEDVQLGLNSYMRGYSSRAGEASGSCNIRGTAAQQVRRTADLRQGGDVRVRYGLRSLSAQIGDNWIGKLFQHAHIFGRYGYFYDAQTQQNVYAYGASFQPMGLLKLSFRQGWHKTIHFAQNAPRFQARLRYNFKRSFASQFRWGARLTKHALHDSGSQLLCEFSRSWQVNPEPLPENSESSASREASGSGAHRPRDNLLNPGTISSSTTLSLDGNSLNLSGVPVTVSEQGAQLQDLVPEQIDICLSGLSEPQIVFGPNERTLLMSAVLCPNLPIVQHLLKVRSEELNQADKDGRTALMLGCAAEVNDAVKLLLEAGADRSPTDLNGLTALQIAEERGNPRLLELFRE